MIRKERANPMNNQMLTAVAVTIVGSVAAMYLNKKLGIV